MRSRILTVLFLAANILCIPMYFVQFIKSTGFLQDEDGLVVEKAFFHSPFENLTDMGMPWLMYIAIAVTVFTVIAYIISLIKRNDTKLEYFSSIVVRFSTVLAVVGILVSTTLAREY